LDNPDLVAVTVIGDGEAETGPLATAWHSNKFLNPRRDGAVLPVLHLNGYKIHNPSLLARIPRTELRDLLTGYGWLPLFVEGDEPEAMHASMAAALDRCVADIQDIREQARADTTLTRPRWPMIVLASPKGWTGPKTVDGLQVEGFWRSHQIPVRDVRSNPEHLQVVENWLRSYAPEQLFDSRGGVSAAIAENVPRGERRMGANEHANGGLLRRPLRLPQLSRYAINLARPAHQSTSNTGPLAQYLRDVMKLNPTNFRVFGPDETQSNGLATIYEASGKAWLAETQPEDEGGSNLSPKGRVMEMLSEHTVEGWLEGYLLSGRHGFLSTYEAFVHVMDSMVAQHAKWLSSARQVYWRAPIASLNILITSTVWRQDHNGFTHQDPGLLDLIVNKNPDVVRIYLPPDANALLSVSEECLASTNLINVIVCDKKSHHQYLSLRDARRHCAKKASIWHWASNDEGAEPDIVIASCGDVVTLEALAATDLLRAYFPDLKLRFVNVVDLFCLTQPSEHPNGLSDREFDALFTRTAPVIFNFHGYPWLIHRLTYRRTNHGNLHVRGYKEHGAICTPLELAIANEVDRFSLAIDAIDRLPSLGERGAHARDRLRDEKLACLEHAWRHGVDANETTKWKWPY
jgi:xylulose-5-phosphate/fructose-6-phosphate phosphoketolase